MPSREGSIRIQPFVTGVLSAFPVATTLITPDSSACAKAGEMDRRSSDIKNGGALPRRYI
ncbi:MAG: hypothetical protein HXS50_05205 [Theionarchaea archaeon]|nr:hypothetical protein [Theionarchaea archaeon]